jgi:hypothetical protein
LFEIILRIESGLTGQKEANLKVGWLFIEIPQITILHNVNYKTTIGLLELKGFYLLLTISLCLFHVKIDFITGSTILSFGTPFRIRF